MQKVKNINLNLTIMFCALAISFAFKNLFLVGTDLSMMPYYYDTGAVNDGLAMNIFMRIIIGAVTAAGCYLLLIGLDRLLQRYGRAFMTKEELIFGVSIYVIIANIINGLIALVYFIQPIVAVFASDIINFIVNTAVFFVMFLRMRIRIPDYMVARAFATLVIPYMAFQLMLFL